MEVMIQGYADMKIDAKLLCVACHWAAKAGAVGEAARYGAISPDQSSDGHYQAHLDRIFPARPESLEYYPIEAPCRTKEGVARVPTTIHTVPPHESLNEEIAREPDVGTRLLRPLENSDWEPVYRTHPVGHELPSPIALYVDGVQFTKQIAVGRQDSLICFVVYNLVTNKRHVVCVIRKSSLCKCGCRGWCTLFPVFQMLKWSFKALYEGRRPSEGHDGSGWGDAVWGRLVGVALIRKGILVQVKADWEAFCNIMGFALWSSVFRPCLCCNVNKELLAEVTGITLEDAPWDANKAGDYEAACQSS